MAFEAQRLGRQSMWTAECEAQIIIPTVTGRANAILPRYS